MRLALLTAALLVGFGLAPLRAADDPPLLTDDFATLKPGWGPASDRQSVSGNRLMVSLPNDSSYHVLYQDSQFDNVDIRLKVTETQGATDQPAGIIFWAGDKGDCYVALIQADGGFYVARRQHGKWLTPVTLKVRAEVQQGVGQVNALRVVTRGTTATIYVNDRQLTSFRGFPPAGKSRIGIHGESGANGVVNWAFSDLQVRQAPAPSGKQPADDSLLFADDFLQLEPSWRANLAIQSANGNAMIVNLQPQLSIRDLYWGNLFGDSDIRIDVTQVAGDADEPAGVIFWAADSNSHYSALFTPDGSVYVARRQQGKWLYPVSAVKDAAVRKEPGQVNTLRVVTSGRWATIYVNDQQVTMFQGFPPDNGSMIGVHAESGNKPATWSFSKLSVRRGPPPTGSPAGDPAILLTDDFHTLDPAWGAANNVVSVQQNYLVMTPVVNTTYTLMYQGSMFGNVDYRAKLSLAKGGVDDSAGIIFWAADYDNRYIAEFYSDGTLQISRKVQGKWVYPFGGRVVDALQKGIGATNELRIVTSGKSATLYVNNQQLTTIRGYPPEGNSKIGLAAASGADPYTWNVSDLSVRQGPASKDESPQDSTLLLAEDFEVLDPAWGSTSDSLRVEANKLIISPKPEVTFTNLYNGTLFTDVDFRAKVSLTKGGGETSGGLVFWAADYNTFFSLDLYPDGDVGVSQRVNGKWRYPVQGRLRVAVRQGVGEMNEMRVVTSGNSATLYINDHVVNRIQGLPPAGGCRLGMQVSSDKETSSWAFSNLSVRKGPAAATATPVVAATPLPDDVVKAWVAAGGTAGWLRLNEVGVPMFIRNGTNEAAGAPGDLPAFNMTLTSPVAFSELPAPPTPFGLMMMAPFQTDLKLQDLAGFKNLQSLTLTCPRANDAGLAGLSQLTSLQSLRIVCDGLTDAGLPAVTALNNLRGLTLNCEGVTDAGIKQLTGLANLQGLNVSGTQATDAVLPELAPLKNLQAVNLTSCKITDAGLQALARFKDLTTIVIGEVPVTDGGVNQLRESLPGCGISR